jgi:hypothetical protein
MMAWARPHSMKMALTLTLSRRARESLNAPKGYV